MAINYLSIGTRIKKTRKHRGISQVELAERTDRSPSYISYIENGVKSMSLDTLVSIANALHCSSDELLKDCLDNTIKASNHAFSTLLADCSEYEKQILLDVITATKKSLRENRFLLRPRHQIL